MPFQGIDVYNDRMFGIFYGFESSDKFFNVIAVIEINIIEPHGFKEVAFCLAIGFPEQFKVLIQSAVVFGDRHLVIVDDYDHIGSGLSGIIKAFICFAAGEGTVADNGDNVIISAFQIACFSDAACQTYRG